MTKSAPTPPRTRAVAVLDLVLSPVVAVRGLARRVGRRLPALRGERPIVAVLAVGSAVVLVGTALLVGVLVRTPDRLAPMGVAPPPVAGAQSTTDIVTPGGQSSAATSPSGSSSPTAAASAAVPHPPPSTVGHAGVPPATSSRASATLLPLSARYSTVQTSLVGYVGSVVITNPGQAATGAWTVTITLPRQTLTIAQAAGAQVRRNGATWIFVPDITTSPVPAGGSVEMRFRVDGTGVGANPTACTIDGHRCDGVPA